MAGSAEVKACPSCGKDVPIYNTHCFSCGYDYPGAESAATPPDPLASVLAGAPPTLVRSYRGKTQQDAAPALQRESRKFAEAGYRLASQSWAAGERPVITGIAGLLLALIGLFFTFGSPILGIFLAILGVVLLIYYGNADASGTISATFERSTPLATPNPSVALPSRPVRDRLLELDSLRDEGLITAEEHATRRTSLLDQI